MEKNSNAGLVSLESLMSLPPLEAATESPEIALEKELNKVDDVLPGLDPIIDIVPPAPIEEEVEEEEEDNEDPLNIKTPEVPSGESNESKLFKESLKALFGDDLGSLVQEVDGVEQEIALDDIDLDSETYAAILKSKIDEAKEEATKNKISADGISEFTKNLIELDKNGGDVRALLEIKQAYSDPLEGLDLEVVEDQKEILYLRGKAAGQNDEELSILIDAWERNGVLEEKAIEANKILRETIDAQMQKSIDAAKEATRVKEENFKLYKTELKKSLGQFELKDAIKTKLLDAATKPGANGKYVLDELYNEWRMTPEKAAEMTLYFTDREEFIKQVTSKAIKEKQLDTARKIKIIPRSSTAPEPKKSPSSDRGINISDLK